MLNAPSNDGISSYLPFLNYIDPMTVATIVFAVMWGLMIFNIDRFIISSTGKGDGKDTMVWSEVKNAIPRILMATILSFTISKPLEIKIFESEINAQLEQEQRKYRSELDQKANAKFDSELVRLEEKEAITR